MQSVIYFIFQKYSINLLMFNVGHPFNWCHRCWLIIAFLNYTLNALSIRSHHRPPKYLGVFPFLQRVLASLPTVYLHQTIIPHCSSQNQHLEFTSMLWSWSNFNINTCGCHAPFLIFTMTFTSICNCVYIYINVYLFLQNILFFVDVDKVVLLSHIK